MASTRQFDHALALLSTLGHAIGRINGCHVHLRAPTGADRGTVGEWIDSLSSGEASRLIDVLLAEGTSLSVCQRLVSVRFLPGTAEDLRASLPSSPCGRVGHVREPRAGHADHDPARHPVLVAVIPGVFEAPTEHPDWSPAPLPRYFDPCPRHVPIVRSYRPPPRPPGHGPGVPAASTLAAFRCTAVRMPPGSRQNPSAPPACHGYGLRTVSVRT